MPLGPTVHPPSLSSNSLPPEFCTKDRAVCNVNNIPGIEIDWDQNHKNFITTSLCAAAMPDTQWQKFKVNFYQECHKN